MIDMVFFFFLIMKTIFLSKFFSEKPIMVSIIVNIYGDGKFNLYSLIIASKFLPEKYRKKLLKLIITCW